MMKKLSAALTGFLGLSFFLFYWFSPLSSGLGDFSLAIPALSVLGIGLGVSALGQGLAGVGSGRRQRRLMEQQGKSMMRLADQTVASDMAQYAPEFAKLAEYEEMYKQLAANYGEEAAKSYFDTSEGRAMLSEIERSGQNQRENIGNQVNLAGGSIEQMLAANEGVNQAVAGATTGLAGRAESRRMAYNNLKLGTLGAAKGTASDAINLKSGITSNARNYAGQVFGNASNYASGIVNNQVQGISQGFGAFGDALLGFGQLGGFDEK